VLLKFHGNLAARVYDIRYPVVKARVVRCRYLAGTMGTFLFFEKQRSAELGMWNAGC